MARGGYQKPNNPAAVSGPGALSRRTDGGVGSKQAQREIRMGKYGESKDVAEIQSGAPLAGSPVPTRSAPAAAMSSRPSTPVTSLFAPTDRPSEPVTEGLPFGPGDNVARPVASINRTPKLAESLAPLLEYDSSGKIRMLYNMAVKSGW
jgi:hypothetical protein